MPDQSLYTDKELLLLIAEGREDAFALLFEQYMPRLYPAVFRIVKAAGVAEDIVQETFLKVWLYRDKLPLIERPDAWIFRVAYHLSFTHLRKQSIRQKAAQKLEADGLKVVNAEDTEQVLSLKRLQNLVKEAILKMPAQQQRVYILSREQGMKQEEIAAEMNISLQTVKNTMGRALKTIREHLTRAGVNVEWMLVLVISYWWK